MICAEGCVCLLCQLAMSVDASPSSSFRDAEVLPGHHREPARVDPEQGDRRIAPGRIVDIGDRFVNPSRMWRRRPRT